MACAACGKENPADARFCLSCGAPVDASTLTLPAASGPRLARLGDRLLAVLLDSALFAAVFALVGSWVAERWGGVTPIGFELTGMPALVALGAVTLFAFLYHWLLEALFGATIGKAIVGVTVRAADGRRCGMKRSLIRNLLRLVDGIGFYLVGFLVAVFSRKRQRLGDHLAHTFAFERGGGGWWRVPLVFVWIAMIAGALWGAVVVHGNPKPAEDAAMPTAGGRVATTTAGAPTAPPTGVVASGDLKLEDFAFLQSPDGPVRPAGPFRPQERLCASFKATGLSTDAAGHVHLQYGIEVLDLNGEVVQRLTRELNAPPAASNSAAISFWLDLPVFTPPGTGKIRATARDTVKNTSGEMVAPFVVDAPAAVASSQLEIRDLHLSLSEGGPPIDPPVVPAGKTVYTEGKLAGVQFRGDQVEVAIALLVTDPQGAKIMDKPDFLEVKNTFAYHPPTFFLPITAHLNLPKGASKGAYREKYAVTDRVSGATRTYELTFKLE